MAITDLITSFPRDDVEQGLSRADTRNIVLPRDLLHLETDAFQPVHGVLFYESRGENRYVVSELELFRGSNPQSLRNVLILSALQSQWPLEIIPYVNSCEDSVPFVLEDALKSTVPILGQKRVSEYLVFTPEKIAYFGDLHCSPVFSLEKDPKIERVSAQINKDIFTFVKAYDSQKGRFREMSSQ